MKRRNLMLTATAVFLLAACDTDPDSTGGTAGGSGGASGEGDMGSTQDSVPKAQDMITKLVEGHETVARTSRAVFKTAESVSDQPTCDLLTQRMQVHEKTAWMLRSLLE